MRAYGRLQLTVLKIMVGIRGASPEPHQHTVRTYNSLLSANALTFSSIPKSVDAQLAEIKSHVSASWLSEPDVDGSFPTNGDSFAARELTKRRDLQGFTRKGFLCQIVAAAWHAKSKKELKQIADKVGRDRIQVVHGTIDNLITPPHAEMLLEGLGGQDQGVTRILFEGRGHYLPLEECEPLQRKLEAMIDKTEALERA